MHRVLNLHNVTQCAMLEGFNIFLVLADRVSSHQDRFEVATLMRLVKTLYACQISALAPSSQNPVTSQTPQKLSKNADVHFFSIGKLNGKILVIYMQKKGVRD